MGPHLELGVSLSEGEVVEVIKGKVVVLCGCWNMDIWGGGGKTNGVLAPIRDATGEKADFSKWTEVILEVTKGEVMWYEMDDVVTPRDDDDFFRLRSVGSIILL